MRRIATLASGFFAFAVLAAGGGMAKADRPLVQGLDGAHYTPYQQSVVEKTQDALKREGLYAGPASGTLDEATMKALGAFQKQHGIEVSGVPTPRTRKQLFREELASATPVSHTR
jgi:peptidoglycan hydrolase-like protein with peptidoglycan-binding domain